MESKIVLREIAKAIKTKHSNIHKLIKINSLMKKWVVDKNEGIPELEDPNKNPL